MKTNSSYDKKYLHKMIFALCASSLVLAPGCAKATHADPETESSQQSEAQISSVRTSEEEARRRSEAQAAIENGAGQKQQETAGGDESDQYDDLTVNAEIPEGEATLGEDGLYYKDGILIVNKKHGVPADYAPGVDPTAQEHVNALISDMMSQGLDISYETSSFRDYSYQSQLYNGYVASNGQAAADTFSARPGFSEHQTGLAFDLKHASGGLVTGAAEAQWLLDHCAEYGFIVRYQEGKESITGYQAEPWHLRYIGDRAAEIMNSGLTLEEYLGVEGGTEY